MRPDTRIARNLAALAAVIILAVGLPATAASAAETIPTECGPLDPSTGGNGYVVLAPGDGYQSDRFTFDSAGRLYVNSFRIVNDSYVVDRLRRYLPSGALDTTWGNNGIVDLPERAYNYTSRTLAVDSKGRLWFARATHLNRIEVVRFHSSGARDTSMAPVVKLGLASYRFDPIGDMVADGTGILLAYGIYSQSSQSGHIGLTWVDESGQIGIDGSSHLSDTEMYVTAVSPEGHVSGLTAEGSFGWTWWAEQTQYSEPGRHFTGVVETDDGPLFYGSAPTADGQNYTAATATLTDPHIIAPLIEVLSEPVGNNIKIAHVDPDRFAVGLRDDRKAILGHLDSGDRFVGETVLDVDVDPLLGPIAVRHLADGSTMIATYHSWPGSSLTLIKTVPDDLGPVVSDQALSDQIRRLYSAYFLRSPDADGLDAWVTRRAQGASLETISNAFAGSTEFTNRYGALSNRQFVTLVYENVLGRSPEATGLNIWTGRLDSGAMTRGQVMVGFSESPEYVTRTGTTAPHWAETGAVHRLYQAYFRRQPDGPGLCSWTLRLQAGTPLSAASDAFARSAEFTNRYGSLTNQQFVELVYVNVLGRAGDPVGIAHWTGRLDRGELSRGNMMLAFSESPENLIRTGTLPLE